MPSPIGSTIKKIWKKMRSKAYRDGFVAAHLSNTVASQIAMLRMKRGWTQQELAEKTGMKQSRISMLEDPNYENIEVGTLKRIASAFDVGLTVRFIPFSELVAWSVTLDTHDLFVPNFANDCGPSSAADKWREDRIIAAEMPDEPEGPRIEFNESGPFSSRCIFGFEGTA
jgi:transcriptional regulator with XRE-family HTH domain